MGTDVWTEEAILVSPEEFVEVIKKTKLNKVLKAFQEFYDSGQDEDAEKSYADILPLKLSKKPDVDEVKKKLCKLVKSKVQGEPAKYGECWVEDSDLLALFLATIFSTCVSHRPIIIPSNVTAFGSYRYSGLYEVELGEPYIVFNVEDCFEKVMTEAGQALSKALKMKELPVCSWSVVSY